MNIYKKRKQGKELTLELDVNEGVKIIINDEYNKADFNLSIDEARALRDSLKAGIKENDNETIKNLNITMSQPEMPVQTYSVDDKEEPKDGFRLFSNDKKQEKRESEFYY